jgi:hypothetical protein
VGRTFAFVRMLTHGGSVGSMACVYDIFDGSVVFV